MTFFFDYPLEVYSRYNVDNDTNLNYFLSIQDI